MFSWLTKEISTRIVTFLEKTSDRYQSFSITDAETLHRFLQPGDILLVEGNKRISDIIKYLTQSTWSHAAFYIGEDAAHTLEPGKKGVSAHLLIEAHAKDGVITAPLSKYASYNTRICRPVGLNPNDRERLVSTMIDGLGKQYDIRNVIDLMRYLIPHPPVPVRWRRRMLALGSGDPTRAICSTLIAQAFQSVNYPILPDIEVVRRKGKGNRSLEREILHIRHHSLFTPRDFDVSPYFAIIKPTIEQGFDYKDLEWHDERTKSNFATDGRTQEPEQQH